MAAATEADDVVKTIRHIRGDDGTWQKLYADTKGLANIQNIEPTKPRTTGRQMHLDNLPADTPELEEVCVLSPFRPFSNRNRIKNNYPQR